MKTDTIIKPLFISRTQLAKMMGVPYPNLRAWEDAGELPEPVKIKGTRLYRRKDIEAFLKQYFSEEELRCGGYL